MTRTALAFCSKSRDAVEEVLFGMQCLTLGTTGLAIVLASSELAEIAQTGRARVAWSSRVLKHPAAIARLEHQGALRLKGLGWRPGDCLAKWPLRSRIVLLPLE
jgi:hypothetical protein